ncbi:hypothetical protein [Arthrobacter sp. D1-17]
MPDVVASDRFDAGARGSSSAFDPAIDEDTWTRARGSALVLPTAMVGTSADSPRMSCAGKFGTGQVLKG